MSEFDLGAESRTEDDRKVRIDSHARENSAAPVKRAPSTEGCVSTNSSDDESSSNGYVQVVAEPDDDVVKAPPLFKGAVPQRSRSLVNAHDSVGASAAVRPEEILKRDALCASGTAQASEGGGHMVTIRVGEPGKPPVDAPFEMPLGATVLDLKRALSEQRGVPIDEFVIDVDSVPISVANEAVVTIAGRSLSTFLVSSFYRIPPISPLQWLYVGAFSWPISEHRLTASLCSTTQLSTTLRRT